jgi:hypothetical protein
VATTGGQHAGETLRSSTAAKANYTAAPQHGSDVSLPHSLRRPTGRKLELDLHHAIRVCLHRTVSAAQLGSDISDLSTALDGALDDNLVTPAEMVAIFIKMT